MLFDNEKIRCKEKIQKLEKENQVLKREKEIMQKYLEFIIDLGYDYDGYNDIDNLKLLIDELCAYAKSAKDLDDKQSIYIDGQNKKYNILHEEV